ncbi:MAG TPA: hypothetical protein VEA99_21315, partial [Gemmatimonadaceae bacterium]|nr:hypothetical protein [Gemmatimonadaceae bacterium]
MKIEAVALLGALLLSPLAVQAQSAAEHVTMGDRDNAAMNAPSALKHYEAAIAAEPKNYAALWRAAREAVDLGEAARGEAERDAHYKNAELYARRAVEANPQHAEGHFHLARSLGRKALSLGARDRVKYAGDVRAHALEALKYDPNHEGALHVMGMWHYNVMSLSGISRMVAKTFLGGQVFNSANWNDAQSFMEKSVAAAPNRIVHRLDLGKVYAARGNKAKAREQWEAVQKLQATEFNDRRYKVEAEELLKKL